MLRKIVSTLLIVVIAGSVWISTVSAGQEKVTVCHKPGTPAEATLEIAAPALDAHLGHGDYEGACTGPQSDGCVALNALVPDPQTNPAFYLFGISDLDFFPGETIHVDLTTTDPTGGLQIARVRILDSGGTSLAQNQLFFDYLSGATTVSVDYVVVAGDDADGVEASVSALGTSPSTFTLDAVNFSCTPAP